MLNFFYDFSGEFRTKTIKYQNAPIFSVYAERKCHSLPLIFAYQLLFSHFVRWRIWEFMHGPNAIIP